MTSISFDGVQVRFHSTVSAGKMVFGNVRTSNGTPIKGAKVYLTESSYRFDRSRHGLERDLVAVTGDDGSYRFPLPDSAGSEQILTACADGYIPLSLNLTLESKFRQHDFVLPGTDEGERTGLRRYDDSQTLYATNGHDAVSIRFSSDYLSEIGAVGSKLESVSFRAYFSSWEKVYVIVDFGDENVLLKDVSDIFENKSRSMTTVDISDEGITIPEGKDIFVGYGVTGLDNNGTNHFYLYGPNADGDDGTWAKSSFLTDSVWENEYWGDSHFSYVISLEISEKREKVFSDFGMAYIQIEDNSVSVIPSADRTLYSTEWFLDGNAVETPPDISSLSSGTHTYMVRITYYDGTTERVYLDVER